MISVLNLIRKNFWFREKITSEKGEINMIAIVLIIIVVIILAVIFKDSMKNLLETIFKRINDDIQNFE